MTYTDPMMRLHGNDLPLAITNPLARKGVLIIGDLQLLTERELRSPLFAKLIGSKRLGEIRRFLSDRGCRLRHPEEDLYERAMEVFGEDRLSSVSVVHLHGILGRQAVDLLHISGIETLGALARTSRKEIDRYMRWSGGSLTDEMLEQLHQELRRFVRAE